MTRHSPLRFALPLVLAASLAACGGNPDVSDTVADDASVSSSDPGSQESGTDDQDTDDQGTDEDTGDGNPGGPGDDGGDDGGEDSGDGGDGNPGGPGDVLVFEEVDVDYGDFRDTGSGHQVCEVEKKCTLAEPDVIEGEEDPETGVDFCDISGFEYSSGVRPNPDPDGPRDVFTEGATVTAQLECDPVEGTETSEAETSEAEESEAEESESEESESEESEESPADESPADDSGDQTEG